MKKRVIHPFFYYLIFVDATVVLPIVINGIRVLNLWYSPLSDTGQITFAIPFLIFSLSAFVVSSILGFLFYRKKTHRFILVRGPMRLRNVIRAIIKDSLGRTLVLTYSTLYLISYLITSGLILIPGVNVDSYFVELTVISYEGYGLQVLKLGNLYLVPDLFQILFGIAVDIVLTLSLILSYYVVSLIYVSVNIYSFPVPKKFRIYSLSTVGGFLSASVPSIGTIAGICCLTPTAINSLLYLASTTLPFAKGLTWKYGIFISGAWIGGVLQFLSLASPVFLGITLIGVSTYYIYSISNRINRVMVGE